MIVVLALAAAALGPGDTLRLGLGECPGKAPPDTARLGQAQIRLPTGQGTASLWLVRSADAVCLVASIPDSTFYWGDDLVVSLDVAGDGGPAPGHDDFQWYLRRVADSSVIYRGRNGRWAPPRDDPDWRLGPARSGGGWELATADGPRGWSLILRLDPGWFEGQEGRRPAIAVRIYDDAPGGWFAWPPPAAGAPASAVERTPERWAPVR